MPVPTAEEVALTIDDIKNPRHTYAAAKIMGESAVLAYGKVYGLRTAIVRYHNVYGPRMGYEHVIPELSLRLLQGEDPLRVYGCDQSRAFCYVSDAVDATVATMESNRTDGEILHIGNPYEIAIEELARVVCDAAGRQPEFERLPAPEGSVSRRCPDITKARKLLAYDPAVDLKVGVEQTFGWYARDFSEGASGARPS